MYLALNHPDRLNRLILNTTAGIGWRPGTIPERSKEAREALATRSMAAIDAPSRETIRKRLEWLMATPDRVTDELVDVRYAHLLGPADPGVAPVRVPERVRGGQRGTRDDPRGRASAGSPAPTLVLWTRAQPRDRAGCRPDDRRRGSRAPSSSAIADAAHWPQWEQPEEHDA